MIRFSGCLDVGAASGFGPVDDLCVVWSDAGASFRLEPGASDGFARDEASGTAIVGDIRLYQRQSLIRALDTRDPELSDIQLALRAYLRWGEQAPHRLLGDFAFAVWDPKRRSLWCVRSPFGAKPLFYREAGAQFWFAADTRDLRLGRPCTVDAYHLLQFMTGSPPLAEETFQQEIRRVRAGACGWVEAGALRQTSYYTLKPAEIGEDPAQQFKALLTQAVEDRMDRSSSLGAMLSGGLDSSTMAVIAARHLKAQGAPALPTFSRVFDETPEWNERPYIEAVTQREPVAPIFLPSNGLDPFAELDQVLDEQGGPFLAPGLTLSRMVFRAAAERGITALLDGHGGDEVVSHGWGRLNELAAAGRFISLWREATGVAATYGDPASPLILGALLHNPATRPFLRAYLRARRALASPATLAARSWDRYLNPDAVQRYALVARRAASVPQNVPAGADERALHYSVLTSGLQPYGLEVLNRNASAFGVEALFPFWDRRVVEFCLGLSSIHKLHKGWTRRILRVSMQGVLPPDIQWRRDKFDFTPHLIQGMLRHNRDGMERLFRVDPAGVGRFVNLLEVEHAYRRLLTLKEAASGFDMQAVWRTVVLSRWLERTSDVILGS